MLALLAVLEVALVTTFELFCNAWSKLDCKTLYGFEAAENPFVC